jgi:hypothetical protein
MGRHQSKLSNSDLKYIAVESMYNPRTGEASATIQHRKRGRMRRRLNIGKFESRRTGDIGPYIDAGVNEMFRILGV